MANTAKSQNFAILARQQRWNRAIAYLANGATVAKAARAAGCDRKTIYLWLARPDFMDALQQERERHDRALRAVHREIGEELVNELQEIMQAPKTRAGKIRACSEVLDILDRLEHRQAFRAG